MSDSKPDITPARTDLLTLTEKQAMRVQAAMMNVADARKAFEDNRETLNNLLAMVQPEGANGFDAATMTFYSEPQSKPEE